MSNNRVSFKAVVQFGTKVISSTGKSARAVLAGVDGVAFFVPALFLGEALAIIKAHLAGDTDKLLIVEGEGSFTMDRYTRSDGEKVFAPVLKVESVKPLRANLKTIEASNGGVRLANGKMRTVFDGVLVADSRDPHPEFGQKLLLKEQTADRKAAFVFVRVPTAQAITAKKGQALTVEGRVTRLFPNGKEKGPETGIAAASIKLSDAIAISTPAPTGVEEDLVDSLPF